MSLCNSYVFYTKTYTLVLKRMKFEINVGIDAAHGSRSHSRHEDLFNRLTQMSPLCCIQLLLAGVVREFDLNNDCPKTDEFYQLLEIASKHRLAPAKFPRLKLFRLDEFDVESIPQGVSAFELAYFGFKLCGSVLVGIVVIIKLEIAPQLEFNIHHAF